MIKVLSFDFEGGRREAEGRGIMSRHSGENRSARRLHAADERNFDPTHLELRSTVCKQSRVWHHFGSLLPPITGNQLSCVRSVIPKEYRFCEVLHHTHPAQTEVLCWGSEPPFLPSPLLRPNRPNIKQDGMEETLIHCICKEGRQNICP